MTLHRPVCFISTGSVLIDLPLYVGRVPAPGGAITGVSSGPVVGGGYTVVSAVARQGQLTALAATLGTGPNSVQARESMKADGVELLVEELVGDIGTCTTLIEPSGRRTFITTEGVEAEPQREDLDRLGLVPGDWVYATGYDLAHPTSRAVLGDWLLSLPEGVGLVVDLGPVQPDIPDEILVPLLGRTSLLTGNHLEMTRLGARLGSLDAIREACPQALLVRRTGVHGCVLWPAGADRVEVPGFVRDVVDTTGAGDTHTGVLVVGLMDGLDPVAAARRANAAAALAVARVGPARAPRREEIDALLAGPEGGRGLQRSGGGTGRQVP